MPDLRRREELPTLTMSIVAHRGHPLLAGGATVEALAGWPWGDCAADLRPGSEMPSLDDLLGRLGRRTGQHVVPVIRVGAAGFALMASGPYLA